MSRRGGVVALALLALVTGACSGHASPERRLSTSSSSRRAKSTPSTGGTAHTPDGAVQAVTTGTVLTRVIPGTTSKFIGRAAMIYLPPVLKQHPNTPLPTIELLHGLPGSPTDWIKRGHLLTTLNAFAAAHHGRAPIVVMPDINGSRRFDTECVSTSTGNVEGYLTTDVQNYVRAHFRASDPTRRWTVAGLSEGGTCAIMLALRHTRDYGTFGEFSGLARPTVGDTDNRTKTIQDLFGGSVRQYNRHDPTWLMGHRAYPSLSGLFACGSSDRDGLKAQALLARLARKARITYTTAVYPGGHEWRVWQSALQRLLQLLWTTWKP